MRHKNADKDTHALKKNERKVMMNRQTHKERKKKRRLEIKTDQTLLSGRAKTEAEECVGGEQLG